MKPRITITRSSVNWANYLDWIVAGWAEMAERGEAEPVRYRMPFASGALIRHSSVRFALRRLSKGLFKRIAAPCGGVMEGEVSFGDRKVRFAYDILDEPWDFHAGAFERCDLYFKAQTALNSPAPFQLSREISMPLPPQVVANWSKVRRAMLGRPLARCLDGRRNLEALANWQKAASTPRRLSLFAYFGGIDKDHFVEKTINGGRMLHANAKRVELVRAMRSWGHPRVDARVVVGGPPDVTGPEIPIGVYSQAVAEACYNVNVSGNANSIPFRFVDSFSVGTAIATDDLAIGWHLPFDHENEVIQFGRIGQELMAEADLTGAAEKLRALADTDPAAWEERSRYLRDRFERLWSPGAFARYVIEECRKLA